MEDLHKFIRKRRSKLYGLYLTEQELEQRVKEWEKIRSDNYVKCEVGNI